jgi:hypothetical protein
MLADLPQIFLYNNASRTLATVFRNMKAFRQRHGLWDPAPKK